MVCKTKLWMSPSDFLSVVTIETNIYASGEAYMYILPNSDFFFL